MRTFAPCHTFSIHGRAASGIPSAPAIIKSFREFIEKNKNELDALQVLYNHKRLHWKDLKQLAEKIKTPPYGLSPARVWQAYKQLEGAKVHGYSKNKVADFVSLLKFELKQFDELEPFTDMVDKRFSHWLTQQRSMGVQFSQEQLNWLEKIKYHIAESIEITTDDFEYAPFDQMGGLGKVSKVFGNRFDGIIEELSKELVA